MGGMQLSMVSKVPQVDTVDPPQLECDLPLVLVLSCSRAIMTASLMVDGMLTAQTSSARSFAQPKVKGTGALERTSLHRFRYGTC